VGRSALWHCFIRTAVFAIQASFFSKLSGTHTHHEVAMKKLKHEAELVKAAIIAGMKYGVERGAVVFEPTDSASEKIRFIYRLLIHDKLIQPLPEDQVSEPSMKHKLAIWYAKQLPEDHPLLR
jgi:hypothetical protein